MGGSSSSDMVDSGVDSQHKSIFKERNISVTEDDEVLSFIDDRFRDKNIMSEEDEESAVVTVADTDVNKKEETEKVS